ncbi:MAG: DUF3048 domain-containing protein [Acidimicrobiia bacterium]
MKLHRRPVVGVLAALAVAGLVLTACGGGDEKTKPKPDATTTTTTKEVPTAPLTGLPDPDGVAQSHQSLGVKIENTPEARPQTGLDVADVVYEEVVEGGITRFWAFFNSAAPETVGPIRSVRSMDPNIILPLGGVVAFSGGTEDNVALVRATGVVTVDENNAGDAYFREPSRSAPHDLYGKTALLYGFGGTPVPPEPLFEYADAKKGEEFTGEPVASFHVNLDMGYDMSYVWDAAKGGWNRFQQGIEPFLAAGLPPGQIAPTNVIVQFIPYGTGADGDVIGTGEAWIFSNGQLIRGTWGKAYAPAATQFSDAAGNPIALTPGRTWVELAPIGTPVDVLPGAPPAAPATTTTTRPKSK